MTPSGAVPMTPSAWEPHNDRDARLAQRHQACMSSAAGSERPQTTSRGVMVEPSWWSEPDAAEERRALTEAFRVQELETATADLRGRCEQLEHSRSIGEVVTVGQVAEMLLGQWSVAFHARLADSQRALCSSADHDRLERAAEDGRAVAVAVRDRYLAPERITGHSLQQALNLANADASSLRLDRSDALQLCPPDRPERSEAADRVSDLTDRLLAGDRAATHTRNAADEHARDRATGRGISM